MCKHALSSNNDVEKSKQFLETFDYNLFCGGTAYNDKTINVNLLDTQNQRIECSDYKKLYESNEAPHLLIDVRPKCQFQICSLPNSISKS